jgi:hypothetical protein
VVVEVETVNKQQVHHQVDLVVVAQEVRLKDRQATHQE